MLVTNSKYMNNKMFAAKQFRLSKSKRAKLFMSVFSFVLACKGEVWWLCQARCRRRHPSTPEPIGGHRRSPTSLQVRSRNIQSTSVVCIWV